MITKVIFKQNKDEIFSVMGKVAKYTYLCFSFNEMAHFEADELYIREAKGYKGEKDGFIRTLKNIGYEDIEEMRRMNYNK